MFLNNTIVSIQIVLFSLAAAPFCENAIPMLRFTELDPFSYAMSVYVPLTL